MNELDSLVDTARAAFAQAKTPAELENAKAQFLGKSGRITELMKGMAEMQEAEEGNSAARASEELRALPSFQISGFTLSVLPSSLVCLEHLCCCFCR